MQILEARNLSKDPVADPDPEHRHERILSACFPQPPSPIKEISSSAWGGGRTYKQF